MEEESQLVMVSNLVFVNERSYEIPLLLSNAFPVKHASSCLGNKIEERSVCKTRQ